ncbi:MAG: DUF4178 domain-containing protein [Candidatus Helarchaeota archaeon]
MSSDSNNGIKKDEEDISIQKINCASCKAPLELYSNSTKFKRCDYCGFVNYIIREPDGTYNTSKEKSSKIGKFRGFGDLQIGQKITIDTVPYLVVGAMRYVSSDSVWYELLIKNMQTKKELFLSYEEGQYILYEKMKKTGITRDLLDGKQHVTRYGTMELYEKGKAKITEFDGEIPYMIDKDEKLEWFDGMIGNRKFSVESVKDEFEVYFGDPLVKVRQGAYRKGGKVAISKEVGGVNVDRAKIIIAIVIIIIFASIFGLGWLITGNLFWMGGGGGGGYSSSGGGGGGGGGGKSLGSFILNLILKLI